MKLNKAIYWYLFKSGAAREKEPELTHKMLERRIEWISRQCHKPSSVQKFLHRLEYARNLFYDN